MSHAYKQIISLYGSNPSFKLLTVIFLLSAAVSKILYLAGQPALAEDISTILFVVTLWLAFQMGLLIKRQFANFRASLLPHYRKPHSRCAALVYIMFIIVAAIWELGLVPIMEITSHGLQGVYVACLLVALSITCVGYLSIGRAFMYGYVVLLILATQSLSVIAILDHSPYAKYVIALTCLLLLIVFRSRLLNLKEDKFEYDYLLSWPPKDYMVNQIKGSQFLAEFVKPVKKLFGYKDNFTPIPPYPRAQGLFKRANHWNSPDSVNIKLVCLLVVSASPLYFLIMKYQPMIEYFFRNTYSNFLLLAITPVLVTVGSQYKKMAYWGHDVLKPVHKKQFMKERGVMVLTHLFLYWLIFCICFAILPSIFFHPEIISSKKFWGFLMLTGAFSFLVLSWLALLSCISNARIVIINGIVLSYIVLFQFYFMTHYNVQTILLLIAVCAISGIFLCYKAYEGWCQREFC